MYIAWLTATANVCPVTLNQWGQSEPSTFSIHVYASTSWAHFKINEQLISHIYGLHCEK